MSSTYLTSPNHFVAFFWGGELIYVCGKNISDSCCSHCCLRNIISHFSCYGALHCSLEDEKDTRGSNHSFQLYSPSKNNLLIYRKQRSVPSHQLVSSMVCHDVVRQHSQECTLPHIQITQTLLTGNTTSLLNAGVFVCEIASVCNDGCTALPSE